MKDRKLIKQILILTVLIIFTFLILGYFFIFIPLQEGRDLQNLRVKCFYEAEEIFLTETETSKYKPIWEDLGKRGYTTEEIMAELKKQIGQKADNFDKNYQNCIQREHGKIH